MIVLFAILATALADVHHMQLTRVGNYDGVKYLADVSIGTPAQNFKVVLSTTSANFYVNSAYGKNFFNSTASETYEKLDGKFVEKWPADVEGIVGKDTVRLGADGLVIPGTIFGQAAKFRSILLNVSEISAEVKEYRPDNHFLHFVEYDVDGVLGLGFPALAAGGITPPVTRAMDLHLLDEPLFTVHMKATNGLVTCGAVDTAHCGQILAYEPLTSKTHWQFAITSVKSGKYHSTAKWAARSDTTNPFIELPAPEAAAIADAHGAKFDNGRGHYVIDCQAEASMELMIGQRKYTIEAKNFVVSAPDGRCVLALKPLNTMTFGYVMSLGVPFHRQFCTVHDFGHERIGLADSL